MPFDANTLVIMFYRVDSLCFIVFMFMFILFYHVYYADLLCLSCQTIISLVNFSQYETFLGKKSRMMLMQLIKLFVNIVQTKVIEMFFLTCKEGENVCNIAKGH